MDAVLDPRIVGALGLMVLLTIAPGPDMALVISTSLARGRRAAFRTALGISTGTLIWAALAGIGVAAILEASAEAFTVVRLLGAAYLVYLGIRALLGRDERIGGRRVEPTLGRTYRRGVVVNVLNPKTALFFVAFLPQFVDPDGSTKAQLAILGLTFVLIALTSDLVWAVVAGTAGGVLRRSRTFLRVQRYVSATIFLALGALAATAGRNS